MDSVAIWNLQLNIILNNTKKLLEKWIIKGITHPIKISMLCVFCCKSLSIEMLVEHRQPPVMIWTFWPPKKLFRLEIFGMGTEKTRGLVQDCAFFLSLWLPLAIPACLQTGLACSGCQTCWSPSQGEFFFFHNMFSGELLPSPAIWNTCHLMKEASSQEEQEGNTFPVSYKLQRLVSYLCN